MTTRDGKMFVADLGFDRVMIYNSIPSSNTPSADVVVGQPDFTTAGFNNDESIALPLRPRARNVEALCESTGELSEVLRVDDDGNDIFGPDVTDSASFPAAANARSASRATRTRMGSGSTSRMPATTGS